MKDSFSKNFAILVEILKKRKLYKTLLWTLDFAHQTYSDLHKKSKIFAFFKIFIHLDQLSVMQRYTKEDHNCMSRRYNLVKCTVTGMKNIKVQIRQVPLDNPTKEPQHILTNSERVC